jgi:hypothetical protein
MSEKQEVIGTRLPRATSADQLFAIDDRPPVELDVPEWGCSIVVRELDAATMATISKSTSRGNDVDSEEFSARVVFAGIVEPALEPHHIELLKKRNHMAFKRVFDAIVGKKKEA